MLNGQSNIQQILNKCGTHPKIKTLQTSVEFRPIGLCNIMYKIVSKMISERLSKILPNVIDESQRTFLKHKGPASTALAGLELIVVHVYPSQNHLCNIVIKLDFSKAFDRIKWPFFIIILQKPEFPQPSYTRVWT